MWCTCVRKVKFRQLILMHTDFFHPEKEGQKLRLQSPLAAQAQGEALLPPSVSPRHSVTV